MDDERGGIESIAADEVLMYLGLRVTYKVYCCWRSGDRRWKILALRGELFVVGSLDPPSLVFSLVGAHGLPLLSFSSSALRRVITISAKMMVCDIDDEMASDALIYSQAPLGKVIKYYCGLVDVVVASRLLSG